MARASVGKRSPTYSAFSSTCLRRLRTNSFTALAFEAASARLAFLETAGAIGAFETLALPQTGHATRRFLDCSSYAALSRNQPSKLWSFLHVNWYRIMGPNASPPFGSLQTWLLMPVAARPASMARLHH